MGTSFYAPRSFANINWQDEALRAFIHEVGDLLQVIYSTVSVLQNSLSAKSSTEQTLLVNLRSRAADSKQLLNIVYDLATPLSWAPRWLEMHRTVIRKLHSIPNIARCRQSWPIRSALNRRGK